MDIIDIFQREAKHENLTAAERAFLRMVYGILAAIIANVVYVLIQFANGNLTLDKLWPALLTALGTVLLLAIKTWVGGQNDPSLADGTPSAVPTITAQAGQETTQAVLQDVEALSSLASKASEIGSTSLPVTAKPVDSAVSQTT